MPKFQVELESQERCFVTVEAEDVLDAEEIAAGLAEDGLADHYQDYFFVAVGTEQMDSEDIS